MYDPFQPPLLDISIHALREEGDLEYKIISLGISIISIHALREEGDKIAYDHSMTKEDFYPRPPRGGRHRRIRHLPQVDAISIHALREEGDAAFGR